MVKLAGRHHVRALRAFVRRKLAYQKHLLAREKEAARKMPLKELPEYDPDDNGRFAGYDAIFKCEGNSYEALYRVLKKILRPAHYRTWAAANGELRNGPAPCLSAKEIAERVGRHRRTIEIDLQELRESNLLHLQPAKREGRWVMEMHYDVLYRLVHEYLEWERSPDYIPPERQYFERIEIDAALKRQLLQFEDYRKVLAKKKPGPKREFPHHEGYLASTLCSGNGGRQYQYIASDAPNLPAASQGGMNRSVNLEPSAPPAVPQAGVSGSTSPTAPVKTDESETVEDDRSEREDMLTQFLRSQVTRERTTPPATSEDEYTCEASTEQEKMDAGDAMDNSQADEYDESDEYTEDGKYIYRAILPPPLQEIRTDKNGTRSIFLIKVPEVPHLEDEQGTLYFASTAIPQLYSDLMMRTRKEYFIPMDEFGPEIAHLFTDGAVGASVSVGFSSSEAPEEDEIVMRVLMSEPEEDEPQDDATGDGPLGESDDESLLKFGAIWTPELQRFLRHANPGLAYFVPRTDFPPEELRKFAEGAVGLWIWKDAETCRVIFDACFEEYLEGIRAQPEADALAEANARYQDVIADNALAENAERPQKETEKLSAVDPSRVFDYGIREIVHGGVAGATYPPIVPLLRDYMQEKLLGGDAKARYFVSFERLGVPHIEQAFPPGCNGVWIWRSDLDRSVHIKPTCSALDPALKNRNLADLFVAVGKLADDDGNFYFEAHHIDASSRSSPLRGS